ncbi:hypothetical protein CWR48_11520 [Oceanobacillus arenosus]|uniref:GerMN domain-containing protein n=1 Tax=Oceanobacillus arenosus TaxID=1229153 RepID=A0A3D8PSR0_9BACI|nr:hypothetical protein [Oceanobacillus arenosus]RDW18209.1 hypothetical protein CWR48_11520 [Oceanobacillus arenosus]
MMFKKSLFYIVFTALFLLAGCKEDEIVVSINHPDTMQQFQIVHVYKLYTDFFEEASQANQEDIPELYNSMIIEPYDKACVADSEYLHMVEFLINEVPTDYTAIVELIGEIEAESINEAIRDALIHSSNLLPAENKTTVCIFPTVDENVPVMVNSGAGKIIVLYNENYN